MVQPLPLQLPRDRFAQSYNDYPASESHQTGTVNVRIQCRERSSSVGTTTNTALSRKPRVASMDQSKMVETQLHCW